MEALHRYHEKSGTGHLGIVSMKIGKTNYQEFLSICLIAYMMRMEGEKGRERQRNRDDRNLFSLSQKFPKGRMNY